VKTNVEICYPLLGNYTAYSKTLYISANREPERAKDEDRNHFVV